MTEIDYGARIRAVCDYLETVPGDRYRFMSPMIDLDGCGCVTAHGVAAGIIPRTQTYHDAVVWLTGGGGLACILPFCAFGTGEQAKQAAIAALRAYADKHYPLTPKHTGLPDVVREIFQPKVAA